MSVIGWTYVVMLACTMTLIVWDVYVATNNVPNSKDTESGIMRSLGRVVAGVPFAFGALGGHFWGPSINPPFGYPWSPIVLGGLAVCLSMIHVMARRVLFLPKYIAFVYFLLGAACGALLWPQ